MSHNNDISKTAKKRNVRVELIRLIACFAVIWYHIRALPFKRDGELSETAVFFECICTICVMTFFLISGFFIYDKKGKILSDWLHLIKNFFITVFVPFILVVIFTIIFHDYLISVETFTSCLHNFDMAKIIDTLYKSFSHFSANDLPGTSGHLWYIFSYMIIIAVYPITRLILTKMPRFITYILAVIVIFIMILDDYYMYYDNPTINYFFDVLHKPVFYSFCGSIIYNDILKNIIDKKNNNYIDKKPFIISKIVFILTIIIYGITFFFLFRTQCAYDLEVNSGYVYTSWLSTFSLIMTTCFVVFVYNLNIDIYVNDFIKNAIYFLASKTLGIYLIHYLIITKFLSNGFQLNFSQNLSYLHEHFLYHIFYSLFIFIISLVIVLIVERIVKLIVGIFYHKEDSLYG